MKTYFTKNQAAQIALDYQWLKNQNFIWPYSGCKIDVIETEKIDTDKYQIVVKVNAFSKDSIPEIFGFVNPKYPLLDYLKIKGIEFYPEKYGFT